MQIVLIGNPNSGKTSLFNKLTGSNQHVGNWPGVTVEKKSGEFVVNGQKLDLLDMPGIYTLDPDTLEQKITRNFIYQQKPDIIINVLDATNLERNLFLTLQLRESGIPMMIVLNMMDEIDKSDMTIDMEKLSTILGVPVCGISASKGTGLDQFNNLLSDLINHKFELKPFCLGCSNCAKCKESEFRYQFIDSIINSTTMKPVKMDSISIFLDKILLNRFFAIPFFMIIMFSIFSLTFGGFVKFISDGINFSLNQISNFCVAFLTTITAPHWIISLISDGIIPGIGIVLVFLPQITILFILMSFLEDSGYMSRTAFIMDKLFSYFGLTGSSFIPLLMGFGCSVPAIMSCRMLPSEKDRKITIMLTSFMSCSARLPLYSLLAGVFFVRNEGLVIFLIYMLGILVALLSALLLNKTVFKSDKGSFVMEIPPYRLPSPISLVKHAWGKVKGFLVKAGTTLLVASIVIWFLKSFSLDFQFTANPDKSILATLGGLIAPIFTPLGFGNWRAATALIIGVASKEMVVSSLTVLSGVGSAGLSGFLMQSFTPLTAFVFMTFVLLYLPCLSAIITIKKELNSYKWMFATLAFSFSIAWITSFLIHIIGMAIGF